MPSDWAAFPGRNDGRSARMDDTAGQDDATVLLPESPLARQWHASDNCCGNFFPGGLKYDRDMQADAFAWLGQHLN